MLIKKLSIIIPAYNEGRTIHLILDKVLAVKLINDIKKEIIIVNDASSDNTQEKWEERSSQAPTAETKSPKNGSNASHH